MKILLLADHMNSGGAETHIFELSRFLSLLGHSVTVLSHGGCVADALNAVGVRAVSYGKIPAVTLAHVIRKLRPHVVHAHTRQSLFLCRCLLTFMNFPLVFTAHAHFSTCTVKRALTLFPRRTIAVSRDIAEHLTTHFALPKENILVIGNGIDTLRFCPSPTGVGGFHIVTVSRLDADCSLTAELLCRISPRLSRKIDGLHITVIGGGSELAKIRRLAAQTNKACGYKAVTVVGQKQNVLPHLHSCHLFVGVSRAALEAMSCAVPVILCGNEGYLGICDHSVMNEAERGNFCARGHEQPTAQKLYRDICCLYQNTDFARKTAADGMAQVRTYHTAFRMAKKTLLVYRAAIADRQASRTSDILLAGYYGYGNLGDELTLSAICNALKTSHSPALPPLRLSVLLPKSKKYLGFSAVCRWNILACIRAIRHTGVFLLGGGSLLQNKTSNRSLFYYLLLLELAHFFGTPCMLYASGIGPIHGKTAIALCRHALKQVDVITARDTVSYKLMKNMKTDGHLFLSADPVAVYRFSRASDSKYVLAFVREQQLLPMYDLLKKVDLPIVLAVMDAQSDRWASQKLAKLLKKNDKQVRLITDTSFKKVSSLISHAALVVSARLHALILAFDMGVPMLGISDDSKISAFMDMAYAGLPLPACRHDISKHFLQKQKQLQMLAEKDAKIALYLAGHMSKIIDKPQKK